MRRTTRQETTAVLMLRAFQLGLRMADLEEITIGDLMDMLIESNNDEYEYPNVPTQDDFRRF